MLKKKSTRATTHLANGIALSVFLLGAAASVIGSRISQQRHDMEVLQIFEAECSAMRYAVSRQLTLFFDVLDSISQLHQLSDNISGEDLEEFTTKGMLFQKKVLTSYGFVQRMPHEIRSALSQNPEGGLSILDRMPNGSFQEAAIRPEYYPIVYQYPADSLGIPIGGDLTSLPGAADAIVRMNKVMGLVIASDLQIQQTDGTTGYFAFSPIFQLSTDGRTVFSGFTVSILWPQQILEQALENVSVQDVLVRFYETESIPDDETKQSGGTFTFHESIDVADKPWLFEAVATKEYLESHQSVLPGVILVAGSAITLLVTMMMMILANRTRRIERVVQQRTKDLENSNQLLSQAMEEQLRLESEILDISEREKQQLGHDLHDSLGQKLTGAVFLSRALDSLLPTDNGDAKEQTQRITEILKDSVAQVRRMARGLSPVELGKEGLSGALRRLAEETSSVFGVACLYHEKDDCRPPAKSAHHLYAIALESVNNAMKHGSAQEIVIELSAVEGNHSLTIEDNGNGFDPASLSENDGMGLRIMKYRASMIGGTLKVGGNAEGGMKISCEFPVN